MVSSILKYWFSLSIGLAFIYSLTFCAFAQENTINFDNINSEVINVTDNSESIKSINSQNIVDYNLSNYQIPSNDQQYNGKSRNLCINSLNTNNKLPMGSLLNIQRIGVANTSVFARGIDVSQWQGNINWTSVKNSGVQFAMIRSGYGRNEPNQKDWAFDQNVRGAQAAGIDTGVYHYSYAESPQDAVNEANFCLSIIRGYKFTYPIVFDIEDDSMKSLGRDTLTKICEQFCNTIEQNGYYAAIYCNKNWLNNFLNKDKLTGRYSLWLADWYVGVPSYNCGIWQYTDRGEVPGISGNVDLDFSYLNYPYIIKSNGLNGY